MPKKILNIVLALLLMVAITGFTISKHYCGNHLFSVSVFKTEKCRCGDKCKDCHTIFKQVKISDNYSVPEVVNSGTPTSFDLHSVSSIELITFTHSVLSATFFFIKAPPFSSKNPIALLQSFRC